MFHKNTKITEKQRFSVINLFFQLKEERTNNDKWSTDIFLNGSNFSRHSVARRWGGWVILSVVTKRRRREKNRAKSVPFTVTDWTAWVFELSYPVEASFEEFLLLVETCQNLVEASNYLFLHVAEIFYSVAQPANTARASLASLKFLVWGASVLVSCSFNSFFKITYFSKIILNFCPSKNF